MAALHPGLPELLDEALPELLDTLPLLEDELLITPLLLLLLDEAVVDPAPP